MFLNLILGGFAGFLTGKLMRSEGYVIAADILLGLAGGQFSEWILGLFGVYVPDWNYSVISIIGAVFLVAFVRFVVIESE